jgi:hypothetical protein
MSLSTWLVSVPSAVMAVSPSVLSSSAAGLEAEP